MTHTRHEILVGLTVTDDARYQAYRDAIRPILEREGGVFLRDFHASPVTPTAKAEHANVDNAEAKQAGTPSPINRVFVLSFPSREARERFFTDPDYARHKAAHFEASVAHTDIIAEYDTERPNATTP